MPKGLVLPSAILFACVLIAFGVYVYVSNRVATEPSTLSANADLSLIPPVTDADHILGNPAAPVVILEYSDFDCPFCKQFHDTLRQLMANYGPTGDVAWVMREFPLTELHPNAPEHAQAAECVAIAGGVNAFWKFADLLFAGQPTDPSTYDALVAQSGANVDQFNSCMSANTTTTLVAKERADALKAGAQGTPFSLLLVKGQPAIPIPGALPYDQLKAAVDQAIAEAK